MSWAEVVKVTNDVNKVSNDNKIDIIDHIDQSSLSGNYGGVAPQQCSKVIVDHVSNQYKLYWSDPDDTMIEGKLISSWKSTTIVRKEGSYPTSISDGTKVVVNEVRNKYAMVPYIDEVSNTDTDYYYKAFPQSDTNAISNSELNEFTDEVIYSFRKNKNDSSPSTRIEYLGTTANMLPAYMDYTAGAFNYGSWEHAFFMPRPCMLNSDGTVAYYLDPNDYSKKEDGITDSEISDTSFDGNAMMQFHTVWLHIYEDTTHEYYNISNKQANDNYKCYAHHDHNGEIMPFTYMPIYNGSYINNVIRSLSGQNVGHSLVADTEMTYAQANGANWNIEVLADRMLVNILLMLIGKSTDTQSTFGNGNYSGGSGVSDLLTTGTMNSNGLFYGTNGVGSGVKVFGMENWWGNQWKRLAGLINTSGTQRIKMTYGTEDGSTTEGYNITGNGYIPLTGLTPSGTSGGYISKTSANQYGCFPYVASGSQTTYETDGLWYDNSQTNFAIVGACAHGFMVGALCVGLYYAPSAAGWFIGASLSCKPNVTSN